LVGTAKNQAVADWLISRVYAALGKSDLDEILPTAYEAVARAYAVARDAQKGNRFLTKARRHLDKLALDREDSEIYLVKSGIRKV